MGFTRINLVLIVAVFSLQQSGFAQATTTTQTQPGQPISTQDKSSQQGFLGLVPLTDKDRNITQKKDWQTQYTLCFAANKKDIETIQKGKDACTSLGMKESTFEDCIEEADKCAATKSKESEICKRYKEQTAKEDSASDYKDAKTAKDDTDEKISKLKKSLEEEEKKHNEDLTKNQEAQAKATQDLQDFIDTNEDAIRNENDSVANEITELNQKLGQIKDELKERIDTASVTDKNSYSEVISEINATCAAAGAQAARAKQAQNNAASAAGALNYSSTQSGNYSTHGLAKQYAAKATEARQDCERDPVTIRKKAAAKAKMDEIQNKRIKEIDDLNVQETTLLNTVSNKLNKQSASKNSMIAKMARKAQQTSDAIQRLRTSLAQIEQLYNAAVARLRAELQQAEKLKALYDAEFQQQQQIKKQTAGASGKASDSSAKIDKLRDSIIEASAAHESKDDSKDEVCEEFLKPGSKAKAFKAFESTR
jgi:DNA repair exonuclease SbcCD ATPase subunit